MYRWIWLFNCWSLGQVIEKRQWPRMATLFGHARPKDSNQVVHLAVRYISIDSF